MVLISGILFYDRYPVLRHTGYLSWCHYLSRNGVIGQFLFFFPWRELDVCCDWFSVAAFSAVNSTRVRDWMSVVFSVDILPAYCKSQRCHFLICL